MLKQLSLLKRSKTDKNGRKYLPLIFNKLLFINFVLCYANARRP
jgi:hypothetical protein